MAEDTDRAVVKTYVPRYQKEVWRAEAEELDMSQSEYVRSMVQAGRRGFDLGAEEAGSGDATPRGDGLETRVLEVLEEDNYLSWDELAAELTDDFEDRLEGALGTLQDENRIHHSGRHGGYTLTEGSDG